MATLAEALAAADGHARTGRRAEAEALLERILLAAPGAADAHARLAALRCAAFGASLPPARLVAVEPHLLLVPEDYRPAPPGGPGDVPLEALVARLLGGGAASVLDLGAGAGEAAALVRRFHAVPVLCVEDDPALAVFLRYNAGRLGRGVTVAVSVEAGLAADPGFARPALVRVAGGRWRAALERTLDRLAEPPPAVLLADADAGARAVLAARGYAWRTDAAGRPLLAIREGVATLLDPGPTDPRAVGGGPVGERPLPPPGDDPARLVEHHAVAGPFPPPPSAVGSVLVVKPDSLGDFVLVSAFLRGLRRLYPAARVTLLAGERVDALARLCPHVDEVLAVPGSAFAGAGVLEVAARLRQLSGFPYDVAVVPRWGVDAYNAAALVEATAARVRLAYAETCSPERRRWNTGTDGRYTHVLHDTAIRHDVECNDRLLRVLGDAGGDPPRLETWCARQDAEAARALLAAHGLTPGRFVALGVSAQYAKRLWPAERYAELARWLAGTFGLRAAVVGGPEAEAAGRAIAAAAGPAAVDLVGRLPVPGSAALIGQAALFVGNDSAPMHLAAATGRPVVEISCHPRTGSPGHDNSPLRFGPWGIPCRVVQPQQPASPCTDGCEVLNAPHCILGVTVAMVQAAVCDLLSVPG